MFGVVVMQRGTGLTGRCPDSRLLARGDLGGSAKASGRIAGPTIENEAAMSDPTAARYPRQRKGKERSSFGS